MPKPRPAAEAPAGAALAHIDRILAELSSPSDPEALNEVRAAFRKKVPLHLRSYAAAALLLEASRQGAQRGDRRRDEPKAGGKRRGKGESARGESSRGDEPRAESPRGEGRGVRRERAPEPREAAPEEQRPRLQGEGTTIFFGMGKRQRLYSRVLLRILSEEGGLALEDIGDIRSFDNYSFADVAPERAEELIAALASFEFRGRVLPVNKARKRGEPAPEPREEREEREGRGDRDGRGDGLRDEGEALAVEAGFDESLEDDSSYDDEAPLGEDLEEDENPDEDASYDGDPDAEDDFEEELDGDEEEKDEGKSL